MQIPMNDHLREGSEPLHRLLIRETDEG